MRILLFPVAVLLLTATATVEAREAFQYRVSVTPVIGYRMGGSIDGENDAGEQTGEKISLDDDSTLGLIINAPFQDLGGAYTEWEFSLSRQSVGLDEAPVTVDPDLEIDITHYLVGGTYVGGEGSVRPYLAAGIGAAHLSPDAPGYDSETVFGFGIGVGAYFFPESRVGLRVEGRALGSVLDSDSVVFCGSGPTGSGCAFRGSGELLLQWEVMAGATLRF
jgi:opacity protein-like surface antigen